MSNWISKFGNDYNDRNNDDGWIDRNYWMFSKAYPYLHNVETIMELGCNAGFALKAFKKLFPDSKVWGYEINATAVQTANKNGIRAIQWDIREPIAQIADLVFTRGVLIHISPDDLDRVYENLHNCSKKYILIAEYYNPIPVSVLYHGRTDMLWKRDFMGDLMDKYPDLKLIKYGFVYHRDIFPQDDITWALFEKTKIEEVSVNGDVTESNDTRY